MLWSNALELVQYSGQMISINSVNNAFLESSERHLLVHLHTLVVDCDEAGKA